MLTSFFFLTQLFLTKLIRNEKSIFTCNHQQLAHNTTLHFHTDLRSICWSSFHNFVQKNLADIDMCMCQMWHCLCIGQYNMANWHNSLLDLYNFDQSSPNYIHRYKLFGYSDIDHSNRMVCFGRNQRILNNLIDSIIKNVFINFFSNYFYIKKICYNL